MVKTKKKIERLSPRARELLDVARTEHGNDPAGKVEYLLGADLKSLNSYDLHKIGREAQFEVSRYHVPYTINKDGTTSWYTADEDEWVDRRKDLTNRVSEKFGVLPLESTGYTRHDRMEEDSRFGRENRVLDFKKGHIDLSELMRDGQFHLARKYLEKNLNYNQKEVEGILKTFGTLDLGKISQEGYDTNLVQYSVERLDKANRDLSEVNRLLAEKRRLPLSVIATIGMLSGIFFLSTNITGNAIADLTAKNTSFIGVGLLVIGLIAGFFWIRAKKK